MASKIPLPEVELSGRLIHRTAKAIQFEFVDLDDEEVTHKEWFPLSQVIAINDEEGYILVSGWIYSQKEETWKSQEKF